MLFSLWTHFHPLGDQHTYVTDLILLLYHSLLGLKTLSFVFPSFILGTFSISYPELLPPQFEFTKFLWLNEQGSFFIHQWKVNELRKSSEKARFSRPFSCNVTLDFCVPYFILYSTYKSYLFLKQMDTSGRLKNNSEQRNMR